MFLSTRARRWSGARRPRSLRPPTVLNEPLAAVSEAVEAIVINKRFAAVSEAIEPGHSFTQSGVRRTFNDLMRAAQVEAIVTRSISGPLTERVQPHYGTVSGAEQRASIAKVIDLMAPGKRVHGAC